MKPSKVLVVAALLLFVSPALSATEYLDPISDDQANWGCTGCSGGHYTVLDDGVRQQNGNPSTGGDYISNAANSGNIDIHNANSTDYIDFKYVTLWIYADTRTQNFQLNADLRNNSNSVASNSFNAQGTGWYSVNWTTPSAGAGNFDARFESTKNGGQGPETGYVYSWYVEVVGTPPDNQAPRWRNQQQNESEIFRQEQIELKAQGKDKNLDSAILATNETGTWENKSGVYGSPTSLADSGNYEWSNFTWRNTSFIEGTVGWKIYYNDTFGQYNVTDTKTFDVVKRPSDTFLELNGTRSDTTYQENELANFTVTTNVSGRSVELKTNYSDGVWKTWDSGTEPLENLTKLHSVGYYEWQGNFPGDSDYRSSSETFYTTVQGPKPVVNDVQNTPQEVEPGDSIDEINVTIKNKGVDPAVGVNATLHLQYPDGTQVTAWGPQNEENTSCGTIGAGNTCSVTYTDYTVSSDEDVGGNYAEKISLDWTTGNRENKDFDLPVNYLPDNVTTVLEPSAVAPGNSANYTFNLTNPFSRDLTDVDVTPSCTSPDVTCTCESGDCSLGTITGGEEKSKQINVATTDSIAADNYNVSALFNYTNPNGNTYERGPTGNKSLQVTVLTVDALFPQKGLKVNTSSGSYVQAEADVFNKSGDIDSGITFDVNLTRGSTNESATINSAAYNTSKGYWEINFTVPSLASSNYYDIVITADNGDNRKQDREEDAVYTGSDLFSPTYRKAGQDPAMGELTTNELTAEVRDAGGLSKAFISTNETGTMKNYTEQVTETASYSTTYTAPYCGDSNLEKCIAPSSLLQSRNSLNTAEPNQPNTVDGTSDETSGNYEQDPSFENVTIEAVEGKMRPGGKVKLTAWVFCNTGSYNNPWVVYTATSTSSPSFQQQNTNTINSCSQSYRKLTMEITLPETTGNIVIRNRFDIDSGVTGYRDYDDVVLEIPSPNRLKYFDNSEDWEWTNFTWQNNSITSQNAIKWRLWFNDSSGNLNATKPKTFKVIEQEPRKLTFETYEDSQYSGITRYFDTSGVLSSILYINSSVKDQKGNPFSFKNITAMLRNTRTDEKKVIEEWTDLSGGNYNSSYGLNSIGGGVYNLTVNASNIANEVRNSTLVHIYPGEGVSSYYFEDSEGDQNISVIENRRLLVATDKPGNQVRLYNKNSDTFFNFSSVASGRENTRGIINIGELEFGGDQSLGRTGENLGSSLFLYRQGISDENADNWWYTNYSYRKEIEVIENEGVDRKGDLTFAEVKLSKSLNSCRNGTRLVRYQGNSNWKEVPTQIVSKSENSGNCESLKMAFTSNVSANSNASYYLYYGNQHAQEPNYKDPFLFNSGGNPDVLNNSEAEFRIDDGTDGDGHSSPVEFRSDTDIGSSNNLAATNSNGCGRGAVGSWFYDGSTFQFSGCNSAGYSIEVLERGPVFMKVNMQKENIRSSSGDWYVNYTFVRNSDIIKHRFHYDEYTAANNRVVEYCHTLGSTPFTNGTLESGWWLTGSDGIYLGVANFSSSYWNVKFFKDGQYCDDGVRLSNGPDSSYDGVTYTVVTQTQQAVEDKMRRAANPVDYSVDERESVYSFDIDISLKSENSDFLTYEAYNYSNSPDIISTAITGTVGDNVDDERYHTSSGTDSAVSTLNSGEWNKFSETESNYSLIYDESSSGDSADDSLLSWIRYNSSKEISYNTSDIWYDGSDTGVRMRFNTSAAGSTDETEYLLSFTKGNHTSINRWQESIDRGRKPEIAFSINPVEANLSAMDTNSNTFTNADTKIKNFRREVRAEKELLNSGDKATALVSENFNNSFQVKAPVLSSELSVELRELNTTSEVSLEPQIVEDYAFSEFYIEKAKSLVAVNDTGLKYKNATLKLPKDGSEPNQIAHCKDWSRSTASCNDWEFNSTKDYSAVENSSHISFNASTFDSYTTAEVARLHVNLTAPPTPFSVVQNDTFALNATAECVNADCGNITAAAHYNASGSEPDTLIPETGDIFQNEFRTNSTSNPKTCDGDLKEGETCKVSWDINATGNISTTRKFDINFSSNVSIPENDTENAEGEIIKGIFEVNVTFDEIKFGALDPATYNNPALNNSDRLYNLTITENNTGERSLWINGSNLQQEDGSDEIPINELSASVQNDSSTATAIKQNYTLLDTPIEPNTTVTSYYWINVSGIYADNYTGKIRVKVNQTS